MFKFINVSAVIDNEYLENIKKKSEQRIVHIFYCIFYIFYSVLLVGNIH